MLEIKIDELDIRKMPWCNVEDWSMLCPSRITVFNKEYVCKEDILRFYEAIIRDVARKIGKDYKEVKAIMDEENSPFLDYVDKIFEEEELYRKSDPLIRKMYFLLIAPRVERMMYILNLYRSLDYNQKEEFKKIIGAD